MKNFIWDFDGTLFDTYTHTVKILHQLMEEVGKPCDYNVLFSKSRRSLGEAREYCKATDEEWAEFYRREGIIELDRYIDNAVMSGVPSFSIIHGKGTGVLRKAVQEHLRHHKNIKSFRLGVFGEGESGVTIAELK